MHFHELAELPAHAAVLQDADQEDERDALDQIFTLLLIILQLDLALIPTQLIKIFQLLNLFL